MDKSVKQLNESTALIRKTAVMWGAAMVPFVQKARRAVLAFADSMYGEAQRAYLSEHKRLPGSTKTKRLRIKRRTLVMEWFFEDYLKREGVEL